jgi:hypothetical protein
MGLFNNNYYISLKYYQRSQVWEISKQVDRYSETRKEFGWS